MLAGSDDTKVDRASGPRIRQAKKSTSSWKRKKRGGRPRGVRLNFKDAGVKKAEAELAKATPAKSPTVEGYVEHLTALFKVTAAVWSLVTTIIVLAHHRHHYHDSVE